MKDTRRPSAGQGAAAARERIRASRMGAAQFHCGDLQLAPTFHGPVNLGNPQEASILDIARCIGDLLEAGTPFRFLPLPPDDPKRRCPNIALARRHLDWEPEVGMAEGLRRTIAYFSGRRSQSLREGPSAFVTC